MDASVIICRGNHERCIQPRPAVRLCHVPEIPEKDIQDIQQEVAELVKRALIQAGDLQDVEEKLKDIVDRTSKITPPPEKPAD